MATTAAISTAISMVYHGNPRQPAAKPMAVSTASSTATPTGQYTAVSKATHTPRATTAITTARHGLASGSPWPPMAEITARLPWQGPRQSTATPAAISTAIFTVYHGKPRQPAAKPMAVSTASSTATPTGQYTAVSKATHVKSTARTTA
ncbi:unnamed protein product [Laminaria digitata]